MSRDIFNVDVDGFFKIVDYYARSSMGALAGSEYQNDAALSQISSSFRRRMVARDFSKQILKADDDIAVSDIILMDVLVERLKLVVLPGGEIITHSSELVESGLLSGSFASGCRFIRPYSAERKALWLKGVVKLFSWLEAKGKLSSVVINKIYWGSSFESGATRKFPATIKAIDEANDELDWMYGELSKWLLPSQFMSFPDDVFVADPRHRWGAAPYHYVPRYYTLALEKLKMLCESRNLLGWDEVMQENDIKYARFDAAKNVSFVVRTELVGNKLRVVSELEVNNSKGAGVVYAFYLLVDGERKEVRWYSALNETVFDIAGLSGFIEVVAFSKDKFGGKLIRKRKV